MKKLLFTPLLYILLILIGCDQPKENATITTLDVSNITAYSAILKGKIELDGDLPILSRGFCWNLEPNPTIFGNSNSFEAGLGAYEFETVQLRAGKTYYARAFYMNAVDTVYGNQVEFNTQDYLIFNPDLTYGTVTDIDGNVYKTIQIGEQTWMAENLKTTRYQNGDPLDHITDPNKWGNYTIQTGAYIYYDNDEQNKDIHGAHYTWYAAADERYVAPVGWHVPTVEDWQKLINYLDPGNRRDYGHNLRETTTAHWYGARQMNRAATNSTGFTAIPSGKVVGVSGSFWDLGWGSAYYWTSTGTWDGSSCVYLHQFISISYGEPNARGFNIRCVKD
jgi:uncharacterized protein (TIGR02145 family)